MELYLINSFGSKKEFSIPDDVDRIIVKVYEEWGVPNCFSESLVYIKDWKQVGVSPFPMAQPLLRDSYYIYIKGIRNDIEKWKNRSNPVEYLNEICDY